MLRSEAETAAWLTDHSELFAEILVPGLELESGDRLRVKPLKVPTLGRGQTISLVVEGVLADTELEEVDIQSLAEGLRSAVLDHQNRGSLVTSILVGYSAVGEECEVCPGLRELRSQLGPSLLLGVIADFETAVGGVSESLRSSADYLVVPVYGQPGESLDDPAYWELEKTEERLRLLDELGVPFRSLLYLEGSARSLSDESVRLDQLAPQVLVENAVRAQSEFQFEGFYRQVFDMELAEPLRDGDRLFQSGAHLVVSRPTPQHVQALMNRVRDMGLANHIGLVFARPVPQENVLGVVEHVLANMLRAEPSDPGLVVGIERVSGGSRRWTLRLTLKNEGDATAVAQRRFNYLELHVPGGSIGTVEMGDFVRMELDNTEEDLNGMARVRRADRLRLFFPFLPTGIELATGDISVAAPRGLDEAVAVARFIGPAGDAMESEPAYWPPREEEEEAEDGESDE